MASGLSGLRAVHDALLAHYGPQGWWPARTRFEMAVGAILVQNTRWTHAARALQALRRQHWLSPEALASAPPAAVASAVRPAGFWRQKSRNLGDFAQWLVGSGGFPALARLDTAELRRRLLARPGVGPETADCMLVYAFRRPVFIADAYARRLIDRLGLLEAAGVPAAYEPVRRWAESGLPADAALMNEFHALVVVHGKERCSRIPRCAGCVLVGRCPTGAGVTGRRSSSR